MRKIHVSILAFILLTSVVVTTTQAGQFGGKEQTAECWHSCLFIDFDLAVADELLRPDFVWHYGFARALAPGQDAVVGTQPAKAAAIALNAGFSELGVVHDAVFSHGQLVEVRWTANGFTPGTYWVFLPQGAKSSLPGTTCSA
jgi:hypothetical protein